VAWIVVLLLVGVSCLWVGTGAAVAQATPPPASPGTTAATTPTTAAPTTLPHGDGGVVTPPPSGDTGTSTPTTIVPASPTLPDPSGRVHALLAEIDILNARKVRSQRARELTAAEQRKRAADADVRQAQQDAVDSQKHVADSVSALSKAVANIHASGPGAWSLPIEGDSAATADEMAVWFVMRGVASQARVPITTLTKLYVDEGKDEGIRGDMAFAQSIVETGSFTNPDTVNLNNFAGVGHCDTCAAGFSFSSPQVGVRGQIQLLKSYAEKDPKYKHPLVDSRLRGPAGCCQTWRQLTRTWATAPNNSPEIL
jgi:hypothetical protein